MDEQRSTKTRKEVAEETIALHNECAKQTAGRLALELATIAVTRDVRDDVFDDELAEEEADDRTARIASAYKKGFDLLIDSEFAEILSFSLGELNENTGEQQVSISASTIYGLDEDRREILQQGLQSRRDQLVEDAYNMRDERKGIAKLAEALGLLDGEEATDGDTEDTSE